MTTDDIKEPRLWRANGWTARVIKNEDDEGWAVEMHIDGEADPVLVGPWTMGRDKKNPKPLDTNAFHTLTKTAREFRQRQVQQQHAALNQRLDVHTDAGRISVSLAIVPDEDDPHAILSARDAMDERLAEVRVGANFKLGKASAQAWIDSGYVKPS